MLSPSPLVSPGNLNTEKLCNKAINLVKTGEVVQARGYNLHKSYLPGFEFCLTIEKTNLESSLAHDRLVEIIYFSSDGKVELKHRSTPKEDGYKPKELWEKVSHAIDELEFEYQNYQYTTKEGALENSNPDITKIRSFVRRFLPW